MQISVELYVNKINEKKSVYIAADGASGADYPYMTAEDIGKSVAFYLDNYYPEIVENPEEG